MNNEHIIPKHIAIIMDGNRRWAKEKGLPVFMGHKKGAETLKNIISEAGNLGVQVVTAFAFSTENWNREKDEVKYLMNLLVEWINGYLPEIKSKGICFKHIGNRDKLPEEVLNAVDRAVSETAVNNKMIFNLALNYGGRDEIVRAIKKIVSNNTAPDRVDEDLVSDYIDTVGCPDPELIIRTSGENRLSGFLLWQSAYSELYFPKVYWPDFDATQLKLAIDEYNHRQRRFGK